MWRADRAQPAQGRFREFIQCDVDTVGTASMAADAENVAVVHDGIRALGIDDFQVRINNRKLLAGIREWAGLAAEQEADLFRIVDKLDKIGLDGVQEELAGSDLPTDPVNKVLDVMQITGTPDAVLGEAEATLADAPRAMEGIAELREVFAGVDALGVALERMQIDLYLTRGLDYYTGPIYEVNLTSIERFGSLAGGPVGVASHVWLRGQGFLAFENSSTPLSERRSLCRWGASAGASSQRVTVCESFDCLIVPSDTQRTPQQ